MTILCGIASGSAELPAPRGQVGCARDRMSGGDRGPQAGLLARRLVVPEEDGRLLAGVERESASPPDVATSGHRWYGWQTLLADATAALVGIGGYLGQRDVDVPMVVAGGVYALGAPVVHWAHGNTGRGFGSLGLRLLLPVGGALLALVATSGQPCGHDCGLGDAAVGAVVGMAAASAIDASALAWEDAGARASDPEPRAEPGDPEVFLALDVRRGTVGIGGRF